MGKQWLNIPMSDEELTIRIKELIKENAESQYPIEEDSYVRLTINDDIVGMSRSSEKALYNSEVERIMRLYLMIKSGE